MIEIAENKTKQREKKHMTGAMLMMCEVNVMINAEGNENKKVKEK